MKQVFLQGWKPIGGMLSGLRRSMSSTLIGSKQPLTSDCAVAQDEECGLWRYLVVDTSGVRPRTDASYGKENKSGMARVKEGTLVDISLRRRAGWTTWLCMREGKGWLHDISPKDHKVRLIEVDLLHVDWQFQVTSQSLPVFPKPSLQFLSKPPLASKGSLSHGELISVSQRIRPLNIKGSFMKLADGRGWVPDSLNGHQVLARWQNDSADSPSACAAEVQQNIPSGHSEMRSQMAQEIEESERIVGSPPEVSELGAWDYIVLDPCGMHLRGSPTYDKTEKLATKLLEGELVKVIERRCGDGTTFLRLDSPSGWAFDVQPTTTKKRQRMVEVVVEEGSWFYRASVPRGLALRSRCSCADDAKTGVRHEHGAVLVVNQRVRVGDTLFLRTEDEVSWFMDRKAGKQVVEGPLVMNTHDAGCLVVVRPLQGIHLLSAPTRNRWAITNMVLLKGARVQLLRSIDVEGESWWYVKKPGGMEGWSFDFNFEGVADSQVPGLDKPCHNQAFVPVC